MKSKKSIRAYTPVWQDQEVYVIFQLSCLLAVLLIFLVSVDNRKKKGPMNRDVVLCRRITQP